MPGRNVPLARRVEAARCAVYPEPHLFQVGKKLGGLVYEDTHREAATGRSYQMRSNLTGLAEHGCEPAESRPSAAGLSAMACLAAVFWGASH